MITALFWAITHRVVVMPYRRFGTTYRSHLQQFLGGKKKFVYPDIYVDSVTYWISFHALLFQATWNEPRCGHPWYSFSHDVMCSPSNQNSLHFQVFIALNPVPVIVLFSVEAVFLLFLRCQQYCGQDPPLHSTLLFVAACRVTYSAPKCTVYSLWSTVPSHQ